MNKNKGKILISLKKARSLVSKITEMIDTAEYSPKIMQQNLAVMGLLKSAHKMLLEKHLHDCFRSRASKMEKLKDEIFKVVRTKIN